MAFNVIDKVNSRLKFLHKQNRFLTPLFCRLLCNALIQPLLDYAYKDYAYVFKRYKISAWGSAYS